MSLGMSGGNSSDDHLTSTDLLVNGVLVNTTHRWGHRGGSNDFSTDIAANWMSLSWQNSNADNEYYDLIWIDGQLLTGGMYLYVHDTQFPQTPPGDLSTYLSDPQPSFSNSSFNGYFRMSTSSGMPSIGSLEFAAADLFGCRSHGVMCSVFRPFRLQPPGVPRHRFDTRPLSVTGGGTTVSVLCQKGESPFQVDGNWDS
jgi:hypothetical protein